VSQSPWFPGLRSSARVFQRLAFTREKPWKPITDCVLSGKCLGKSATRGLPWEKRVMTAASEKNNTGKEGFTSKVKRSLPEMGQEAEEDFSKRNESLARIVTVGITGMENGLN